MAPYRDVLKSADILLLRDGGIRPPPEVIESWPQPNYVNPETHDWSGAIICIAFLAISITVFTTRMWARYTITKNVGVDDWIVACAILPLVGTTISTVLAIRIYGLQWHVWDQTKHTNVTSRRAIIAIEMTYLAATCLTKISILCFYKRITSRTISRTFVYCIWASMGFVIAYFVAFSIALITMCNPVEGYWRLFDASWRKHNKVNCHNEGAIIISAVVISTVQDFFICALPALLVWNLQIPKRQKLALIALFGMGILTSICGVMRTYYAVYVYYGTYDISWYSYYGWIWTVIEADLGVVCASAPALKPFFRRYFKSTTFGSTRPTQSSSSQNGTAHGKTSRGNSSHTFGASNLKNSRWDAQAVPLDRIQVRRGMDVVIEDREDWRSQASNSSLRNLTVLPLSVPSSKGHSQRWGSRTTCERAMSRGRDTESQAERQ
ncbi:hypothetical protein CC80DRAFT_247354 [Byssothecium circinans]|uniref:Rhodopsin domain-containing protein n=1 Tax=Byssothecium circinans TaxID=147558 RepID=A0A6A5TEB3_9PLEO|nr:hypothetical protein CC80DRAFT_247354 [Byssothecium circinans]